MKPIKPDVFVLDVTGESGVPFRVVAIPRASGGPTNRYRAPAGKAEAVVEFYDRRYPIDGEAYGQFTGGYYGVSTLLGRDEFGGGGLDLNGDVAAWTVDAASMAVVRAWLALLEDGGRL